MNNSIPPFRPERPDYDQRADFDARSAMRPGPDGEIPPADTDAPRTPDVAAFGNALEGALDKPSAAGAESAPPLTPDEQQMIYRYFPEAPGLALRLYDQKLAAKKVDPGSVGARVDVRG